MEDYPSNSYRSKFLGAKKEEPEIEVIPEKKVEKVVTGKVTVKKKTAFSKFADSLIQEDIGSIRTYIFGDVLIPAVKKLIKDTVTNGIDMLLYGSAGGSSRDRGGSSRISYTRYSDRDRSTAREVRATYDYDDVIFESRAEAEEVLCKMDELIAVYRWASVADYYDLCDIQGTYTDNKYGWSNLRGASVIRTYGGGYTIKLPKAIPLD